MSTDAKKHGDGMSSFRNESLFGQCKEYLPEYDMLDGDAMYEELVVGVIAEK